MDKKLRDFFLTLNIEALDLLYNNNFEVYWDDENNYYAVTQYEQPPSTRKEYEFPIKYYYFDDLYKAVEVLLLGRGNRQDYTQPRTED